MNHEIKIRVGGFGDKFEEHHITDNQGGHIQWEHYGTDAYITDLTASNATQGIVLLTAAIAEASQHPQTASFSINVNADEYTAGDTDFKNGGL